eukprot:TRINITY_DN836_c0_g3_i1.p3 TRINITY_DN836_c0_g3~~TRINITY_DN836_c0_g3_i1.p3  ORF type:complete len:170 (-),score=11.48 TRINITY_DN836_c0_g3_i1:2-511(-)
MEGRDRVWETDRGVCCVFDFDKKSSVERARMENAMKDGDSGYCVKKEWIGVEVDNIADVFVWNDCGCVCCVSRNDGLKKRKGVGCFFFLSAYFQLVGDDNTFLFKSSCNIVFVGLNGSFVQVELGTELFVLFLELFVLEVDVDSGFEIFVFLGDGLVDKFELCSASGST